MEMNTVRVSTDFHTGPVTALSIINSYVLAGVGGNVLIFDLEKKAQVGSSYVLPCRNVHGIERKTEDSVFCVYGEKCFRVISLSTDPIPSLSFRNEAVVVEDWILAVTWLHKVIAPGFYRFQADRSAYQLALALSHNVVLLWDGATRSLTQRVGCVETCILYCAHFIGSSWSSLILAAGTVFNQVVLWVPSDPQSGHGQREVIHRLESHQGVIFSIDYHPKLQVMASVSDDRTIRLWRLKFPNDSSEPSAIDWAQMESSHFLTLYGHSARVWDIQLLNNVFVSVGEDATCLVWNYSGKIIHKFKGHKGKSIWSMACDSGGRFVVTGGGDTSVRMWLTDDDGDVQDDDHNLAQYALLLPSNLQVENDDFPRSIALPSYNTLLVMSNGGCLLKLCMSTRTWTLMFRDIAFSSYTIMVVSPDKRHVALGNIGGTVTVFHIESGEQSGCGQLYPGKVFGLVWVDDGHLLTTGADGVMLLVSVPGLTVTARLTLPMCKQRWVCAGVLLSEQGVLVCGDRGGTVHCYRIDVEGQDHSSPVSSFGRIHGKAGVTDVCLHGNTVYTAGRDGLYRHWDVTDRNIKLRSSHKVMKGMDWIDRINVSDTDTLVFGFHSSHFTLWSVAENLCLMDVECGGGHRAWDCHRGDNSARFVYIKTKQVIVCDTTCRSRQVILKNALHGRELCDVKHVATVIGTTGAVHLVATCSEDGTVQLVSVYSQSGISKLTVHHTLQGHLSSVKTLTISEVATVQGQGEGNESVDGGGQGQGDMSSALSSTGRESHQTSKSFLPNRCQGQMGDNSGRIMFSGGGRAQIQVWRVIANKTSIHKAEEHDWCSVQCSYEHLLCVFLGGETFRGGKLVATSRPQSDPETRVVCLTAFCLSAVCEDWPGTLHVVAAACSDSYVRVFAFNEDSKMLTLLQQSNFHSNCVLKVTHIIHKSGHGSKVILLSGATDGVIAFWDITRLCLLYIKSESSCDKMCPEVEVKSTVGGAGDGPQDEGQGQCQPSCDNDIRTDGHSCEVEGIGGLEFNPILTSPEKLHEAPTKDVHVSKDVGLGHHVKSSIHRQGVKSLRSSLDLHWVPVTTVKAHQSGINSLHCFRTKEGQYMVASGGDDNCLTVTTVSVDSEDVEVEDVEKEVQLEVEEVEKLMQQEVEKLMQREVEEVEKLMQQEVEKEVQQEVKKVQMEVVNVLDCRKNTTAHATQITGVWMVSESMAISASIDQRICVWKLTDHEFKMLCCHYVHFADISNMDVSVNGSELYLYVCGEGLSVIHMTFT